MSELKYLASITILKDSPLAKMIAGFINVLLFDCCCLLTAEINSVFFSSISNICLLSLVSVWVLCLHLVFLKLRLAFVEDLMMIEVFHDQFLMWQIPEEFLQ